MNQMNLNLTYNWTFAFKKWVFQLVALFRYSVIVTLQAITGQYFFLSNKNKMLNLIPIQRFTFDMQIKCTFLQQSLSSRHIFNWALMCAQGDLSASCSPSSEYDNGILCAKCERTKRWLKQWIQREKENPSLTST